jgi:transcriptional regulator with XRE-family HTH domain
MSRRSHFAHAPSEDRGAPLTPQAMSKIEFGRRLQRMLDERSWSQADLCRAVEDTTGRRMGRDAVSTYINGRSFPTPTSLNLLCRALGVTKEELFPNALMNASDDEHPAFEMRAAAGHPGRAWVRVNRMMTFETAAEIARLLNLEDQRLAEEKRREEERDEGRE